MNRAILALGMLVAGPALAQQPAPKPPDPLIEEVGKSLSPEGIRDRQIVAIKALAEAYEKSQAALAAERAWWADYVKGLKAGQ